MYYGLKDVNLSYGKKKILNNFTLEFEKGLITALVGKNGSGKSTILKALVGSLKPESGDIILEDVSFHNYKRKDIARKIGYLPQSQEVINDIDVYTLVSYGRYPYKNLGFNLNAEDKKKIDEALVLVGLKDKEYESLKNLSGGERQRAWLGMILVQEAKILILDEPTTYLDITYQIEVLELIKKLKEEYGLTIILVLHDLNLTARYADKVVMMKDGMKKYEGNIREILNHKNLYEIFEISMQILEDEINHVPYFIPMKEDVK